MIQCQKLSRTPFWFGGGVKDCNFVSCFSCLTSPADLSFFEDQILNCLHLTRCTCSQSREVFSSLPRFLGVAAKRSLSSVYVLFPRGGSRKWKLFFPHGYVSDGFSAQRAFEEFGTNKLQRTKGSNNEAWARAKQTAWSRRGVAPIPKLRKERRKLVKN